MPCLGCENLESVDIVDKGAPLQLVARHSRIDVIVSNMMRWRS